MSFNLTVDNWSPYSGNNLSQIHDKSLHIIENCGIRFHSKKARDILSNKGAEVDGDIVRIPGHVIEEALAKNPNTFTLCARNPKNDLTIDSDNTYLSADGCSSKTIDFETGKRRFSTKEDIENIAVIADSLDLIDIVSPMVSAQNMPKETRVMHELAACLENTEKHVLTESVSTVEEARQQISVGAAIAGGKNKLRNRPIFSNFVCTISPLTHDKGGIEAALTFAQAGVPVGVYSMATAAVSSPATLAGTLAVINAEVISALALIQLAQPGAKVFYSGGPATIDLRTGGYVGSSPEAHLLRVGVAKLADHYNVPAHVGAGATSAKVAGPQHGSENALSFLLPTLARADILFGFGLLDGSNLLRYENLVLDHEIAYNIKRILRGVNFEEENFALGLTEELGPGGVYLNQNHTVKTMRQELTTPYISNRLNYEAWEERGGRSDVEVARDKVKDILENHKPSPLSDEAHNKLTELFDEAEADL